ncbi:hypothetical protein [Herbiconiux sp. VKM Ac-1786]|uniref:hypothetical protein n=1 Tax=Herbiconiux sp. VKM Ac-1786 TaxID=2783824 RepID=UPI001E3C034D|nr:hypothetical protein [Herbiconiux sp. VKM Ac-1786]
MATFPTGARVFVDECKARGYWIAAAAVMPQDAASAERALRRLTRSGQSRIHFRKESDSSRRRLLSAVCALEVQVPGEPPALGERHGGLVRPPRR